MIITGRLHSRVEMRRKATNTLERLPNQHRISIRKAVILLSPNLWVK